MLCRVADSLYWIFRYIERAENLARFLEVGWSMTLDSTRSDISEWTSLVDACADRQLFERLHPTSSPDAVIQFITRQKDNPNTIRNCVAMARENARQIRETLPAELFEELNSLYLLLQEDPGFWQQQLPNQLYQIRRCCQTLYGIQDCTMQRDQSWLFAKLGKLIERSDKTARLLDVKYFLLLPKAEEVGGALDELQWIALLRSVGGYQMFRRQHYATITPAHVAEFLLLNQEFPHSVNYCITEMINTVRAIERSTGNPAQPGFQASLHELDATLSSLKINELIQSGLHEGIDALQCQLNTLHSNLQENYFTTRPCTSRSGTN